MVISFPGKIAILLVVLAGLSKAGFGQPFSDTGKIKWISFTEAVALADKQPKKIFIDVFTKWCGWCKRMDASTFSDGGVAEYMNQHYYAVKLDAETKDTIRFRDKIFVFKPEYKSNEIAVSLLNGKMSYPTMVYLDESFNLLSPAPGYQTKEQILPQLKYFAENIYKEKTWEVYQKEVSVTR